MRLFGYRRQRTLTRSVTVRGLGLITGRLVSLHFHPAPAHTGLVFLRSDLGSTALIPVHVQQVTATQRRTTLGDAQMGVTLVEHVLAAFAGLRIDNCLIELNGPEPPGLDGSAQGFCEAIQEATPTLLPETKPIFSVTEPVRVQAEGASLTLYPATTRQDSQLQLSYLLDYGPRSAIARQRSSLSLNPATFQHEVAPCRTFLLEQEVQAMLASGIGRHLQPSDLLVFGACGPINNRLRFADEPARHKILDMIGDLALSGADWVGHLVGYRSGHSLNVELARQLFHLRETHAC